MRKMGHAGLANLRKKPRSPGSHQEAGPKDREVTGNLTRVSSAVREKQGGREAGEEFRIWFRP